VAFTQLDLLVMPALRMLTLNTNKGFLFFLGDTKKGKKNHLKILILFILKLQIGYTLF